MKMFTGILFILAIGFLNVNPALAGQEGKIAAGVPSVQTKTQESSQRNPQAIVVGPSYNTRAVIDPHERPASEQQGLHHGDINPHFSPLFYCNGVSRRIYCVTLPQSPQRTAVSTLAGSSVASLVSATSYAVSSRKLVRNAG